MTVFQKTIIIVFGFLLILHFAVSAIVLRKGWQSLTWPSTDGTIVTSRVESYREPSIGRNYGGLSYRHVLTYQYVVSGQAYRSSHLSYSKNDPGEFSSQQPAQQYVNDHFPSGAPVTVFYNPQDPREATLAAGISGWTYIWITLIAASIVGLGTLIFRNPPGKSSMAS